MKNFEKIQTILKENNIEYKLLDAGTTDYSVDTHVKKFGISYSEGLSTLIFKVKDEFIAILRRDDRNIDNKKLKAVLGTGNVTFASKADVEKLGLEVGLASPFLLPELQKKYSLRVLADEAFFEMRKVVCGFGHAQFGLEVTQKDVEAHCGKYERADVTVPNPKRQNSTSNIDKKRILTGDRPTGKLHIGHLLGSLIPRVTFQEEYETYILIANIHALSDNRDNPKKVKDSIMELLCDYYASGLDFNKATVYIQSEVPETHEIFMYLSNFVTIQQLMHNPTLKTEITQNKMEDSTPLGFFIYPTHQAADILCVNADLVPVGRDQAPMIEDTREVARKFNNAYSVEIFGKPQAHFGVEKNVPGIDGNAKMGKSLNNGIYLSDSEEELKKKIMSVYTDPNRIHITDPGTIEGNVAFTYHDLFNKNQEEVEDLKKRYQNGQVGDVEVKEKLFVAMNQILAPIREKRQEAESKKEELLERAIEGSRKVSAIARGIADQMKEAMKINY